MNFFEHLADNYHIDLNPQQKEGVTHLNGPCLMLAVPGAGKTTTLLARTAYLIKEAGISPDLILSITFSRASANDMKERYLELFGSELIDKSQYHNKKVNFSTIHSFSYRIVMGYYKARNIELKLIEGSNDSKYSKFVLLKQLFFKLNHEYISDSDLEILINDISFVKNSMFDEFELRKYKSSISSFHDIRREYERIKQEDHLIDFDDMLVLCNDILSNNPNIRETYQKKYQYVQVDEAQDTSRLQHNIIELIVDNHKNIFYVADDDQSIYGFRAADPDYLLNIKEHFETVKIHKMEENYRSTKSIVSICNQFIKTNTKRFDKNIHSNNEQGETIEIVEVEERFEQMKHIFTKIEETKKNQSGEIQSKLQESIAILYRNNHSAISIVQHLVNNDIPFYIKDTNNRFFSHWLVADMLSILEFSKDPSNIELFAKFYYKLRGYYISKQMVDNHKEGNGEVDVFDGIISGANLNDYQMDNIRKLQRNFRQLSIKTPKVAMNYLLDEMGYREFLKDRASTSDSTYDTYLDLIRVLKNLATGCFTAEEVRGKIKKLEQVMKDASKNKGKNVVTLCTIHSSKGLEWDQVYLIDLLDGLFPNMDVMKQVQNGNIEAFEEERRLFYVAMTRAKSSLSIMKIKNTVMSPFVREVEEIIDPIKKEKRISLEKAISDTGIYDKGDYQSGKAQSNQLFAGMLAKQDSNCVGLKPIDKDTKITHSNFGKGTVISCDESKIQIQFEDKNRILSLAHCINQKLIQVS